MKNLRKLFALEDRQATQLAQTRVLLEQARRAYAAENNLGMLPRMERLKAVVMS